MSALFVWERFLLEEMFKRLILIHGHTFYYSCCLSITHSPQPVLPCVIVISHYILLALLYLFPPSLTFTLHHFLLTCQRSWICHPFDTLRARAGRRGEEGQPQLEYFNRRWSSTWPYHLSSAYDPPFYPVRHFYSGDSMTLIPTVSRGDKSWLATGGLGHSSSTCKNRF